MQIKADFCRTWHDVNIKIHETQGANHDKYCGS